MLQKTWNILIEKSRFFADLLIEHIEISLIAIFIAILAGGLIGILISEFGKIGQARFGSDKFLIHDTVHIHAGLSDSVFGSRKCDRRHRFDGVCAPSHGEKHPYGIMNVNRTSWRPPGEWEAPRCRR